jgi:hypothetical protein
MKDIIFYLQYNNNKIQKLALMADQEFKRPLREIYNIADDISDNPSKAKNTYSKITIMNSKNEELCRKTKDCLTRVYTQDLYNQHEDRFMFAAMTMIHLNMIKEVNPAHRWTGEIIIPPTELILSGFERLLENTLSQKADAFNAVIFGGAKFGNDDDDNMYKINENNYINPADFVFLMSNMVLKVPVQAVRFCHYGKNQHWDHYIKTNGKNLKIKFFDFQGNIISSYVNQEDPYTNIIDDTQPIYQLSGILEIGLHALRVNISLKYIDLHIRYLNDVKNLPNNVKILPSRIIFNK